MSTVGSVLISFGAGTAGYMAGSKAVKDDAASVQSSFGGVTGSIAGLFSAAGIGLSAVGIVAGLKSASEEVVNLTHDAAKLSVSTEELSRLRFAAQQTGVDTETLSHAMLKLQEETGKAAKEGGEGAAKFAALGLNAKKLADESPAKEFAEIAEKIKSIHNPAERAAAEVALFGKSGAELGPLLAQGAAGIKAAGDEADRLGVTISAVDAETMLRASQAVAKVEDAVSGLAQHIAIKLAPFVEDAANRMVAWAEEGGRMGKIVSGALTGIEYAGAGVVTMLKIGEGNFELVGAVGAASLGGLVKAFGVLADWGSWAINKIFGTHIDTSGIDKAADDLAAKAVGLASKAAANYTDAFTGTSAVKVFQYFDGIQAKAQQTSADAVKAKNDLGHAFDVPEASENLGKITAKLAEMHKAVDEFGLSEGAKQLHELKLLGDTPAQQAEAQMLADQLDKLKQQADVTKQLTELKKQAAQAGMDEAGKKVDDLKGMGATADQIAQAQQLQHQIESVNAAKGEAKKLDDEAKTAMQDALSPLQKEQEHVAELTKLYETGRLTKEQFAAAKTKAESDLHGAAHFTQEAVTRGSQESFKLMNEINNRGRGGAEDIAKKQLAAAEKVPTLLDKLIDKVGMGASLALATIGA